MNKTHSQLKAQLTKAVKSGDASKVVEACRDALQAWGEWGYWPDQWSDWDRALGDATKWQIGLDDLAEYLAEQMA